MFLDDPASVTLPQILLKIQFFNGRVQLFKDPAQLSESKIEIILLLKLTSVQSPVWPWSTNPPSLLFLIFLFLFF